MTTVDSGLLLGIVVYGAPAPQGSKRHVGNGRMVESSIHVAPWREAVKHQALEAVTLYGAHDRLPLDGPIVARMVFTLARPKSHYRTGRNAYLLRDSAPSRPTGYPDLSKLLRSTEDALSDARIWTDDARVVEYQRAAKVWIDEDGEALVRPGAYIALRLAVESPGPGEATEVHRPAPVHQEMLP